MISDASLVLRARGGDEVAFRHLSDRHRDLISITAAKFFPPPGFDKSDLRQEAEWGFAKAVSDYRPDRGSSFRNFAELCVHRQLITAVKTALREKHSPLNHCRSMEAEFAPPNYSGHPTSLSETLPDLKADPVRQLEASEQFADLRAAVWTHLSDLERAALRCRLDGVSYEEVAEQEGVSTKTIDNAIQRAKRKLAPIMKAA